MSIDIRDRIICTSFSSISDEREIRISLALSSEQNLKGTLIDSSSYYRLLEDVVLHKNVSLAINFPYQGLSDSMVSKLSSLVREKEEIKEVYVSLNKFDVQRSQISNIREFIKDMNNSCDKKINFAIEASWINSSESIDKICSVLEPYEKHALAISTYCKKPEKLNEILAIGKHLSSNGSCKYSYFGALPSKQEGIVEILSGGFVYCGVPRQFLGVVI